MNLALLFSLALTLFWSPSLFAGTIYTCKDKSETSIVWSPTSKKYESSSESKSGKNSLIFVADPQKPKIRGNAGESELKQISATQYADPVAIGHVVLWTLIAGDPTEKRPTILIQNKAYKLMGMVSTYSVAYECE